MTFATLLRYIPFATLLLWGTVTLLGQLEPPLDPVPPSIQSQVIELDTASVYTLPWPIPFVDDAYAPVCGLESDVPTAARIDRIFDVTPSSISIFISNPEAGPLVHCIGHHN